MRIVVDTNVIARLAQLDHAQNPIAHNAAKLLRNSGHRLVIVPQVVYEFWTVATRPEEANGLGFSTRETEAELDNIRTFFKLLRDERGIYQIWEDLISRYEVKGKRTHDARLVAAMVRHGIGHLLTFNVGHFSSFAEIRVIDPERAEQFSAANPA